MKTGATPAIPSSQSIIIGARHRFVLQNQVPATEQTRLRGAFLYKRVKRAQSNIMTRRSKVFTDKISITVPVPYVETDAGSYADSSWSIATENLCHVVHRGENLMPARGGRVCENYRLAWKANIAGNDGELTSCLIQAWPKYPASAYLRLEWNPSRAAPNAVGEIKALMTRCIPGFDEHWGNARISRVDVTLDIYRQRVEHFFSFTKSSATRCVLFRKDPDDDERLTGLQLGAGASNRRLSVYDKTLESTRGVPKMTYRPGHGWCRRTPMARTRFEFRLKDLGRIANLHSFENSLLRYSIASARLATEYSGGADWQQFVTSCIRNAAQLALGGVSCRKRRSLYRMILNTECTPDWFDREILWVEAKAAIATALNVDIN